MSMTEIPKHSFDSTSESLERPSKVAKTAAENLSVDEDRRHRQQPQELMSPNPRIQRYLVAIEYIGTRFSGSQQQTNCRTVVGALEARSDEAFHKFIGQPVSIFCSSRTDAGVHALSNVCHVDVERISKRKPGEVLPPHEPTVVRRAVNHFLQKNEGDIMVIDVRCVPPDFHARYKAQERTYFYRLLSGSEPLSTFEKDRAWHVPEELDILAMQEACKVLVGHHDFSSFRAAGCQAKSPLRTLDELEVSEIVTNPYFPSIIERRQNPLNLEDLSASSNKSGTDMPHSSISTDDRAKDCNGGTGLGFGIRRRHRCLVITARARSFLYHQVIGDQLNEALVIFQVRLLVGVLKTVGTGELKISDVEMMPKCKICDCGKSHGPFMWSLPWACEI
ncbi:tRNA pseudouridine synthase A [Morella rubra]|uniref:tRNA pseudouridine synthase n=1 Tax=Morella rubra TaxID=262757 RepID=A0A6A1V6U6_9ROSI|nr:tRNA pseudouridine synthase A [Morella rubra]